MPVLLIVTAGFALVTLLVLGLVVLSLVRRVKELAASVRAIQDELEPALTDLSRETAVAQRELERLANAASEVRDRPER